MNISDSLLKTLKCCIGHRTTRESNLMNVDQSSSHIVQHAHILSCGGNACKKCLDEINGNLSLIKCKYCLQTHSHVEYKYENPIVNNLIDTFSNDLVELIKREFNESLVELDDIDKRFMEQTLKIEHEIDTKMNFLKKRVDDLGEELRQELEIIRVSWKKCLPHDKIEILSGKFQVKNIDDKNFYDIQEKTMEMREIVARCLQKLNEMKFVTSEGDFDKQIIGEFIHTTNSNNTSSQLSHEDTLSTQTSIDTISSKSLTQPSLSILTNNRIQTFDIGSETLYRCTLYNNQIVLSDFKGKQVKVINKQGELKASHNPSSALQQPLAICSSQKRNHLFIGDCAKNEINIVDVEYNLVRSFSTVMIKSPNCMTIDDETGLLYVTDWNTNLVCVFDTNLATCKLVKYSTIDSPMHIKLQASSNSLLVLSAISFELNAGNRLQAITKGSNCIFEVCKTNLTILNTISAENWFHPRGLDCTQTNGIILTTALLLDDDNYLSSNRHLFIINQKELTLSSIELSVFNVSDLVFYDSRLFTCYQKEITIHEYNELKDLV